MSKARYGTKVGGIMRNFHAFLATTRNLINYNPKKLSKTHGIIDLLLSIEEEDLAHKWDRCFYTCRAFNQEIAIKLISTQFNSYQQFIDYNFDDVWSYQTSNLYTFRLSLITFFVILSELGIY